MIPKKLKTPLRWPGGKSRATNKMFPYLPKEVDIKEYREGFLGGGSVAIAFSRLNPDTPVWVNDLYYPLYNFWCVLKDQPTALYNSLIIYKEKATIDDTHRELFFESKDVLNSDSVDPVEFAARFYIINKCSFSGLTESSSFSKSASVNNFSVNGINNLLEYPKLMGNWKITNQCYSTLLCDDPGVFVYLDPPYDIKDSLYGKRGDMHRGFDHDQFALNCKNNKSLIMISYNSDKKVKDRFDESVWNHVDFELTYTMRSTGSYNSDQRSRKELLMMNYD